jgi:hypothetical protein
MIASHAVLLGNEQIKVIVLICHQSSVLQVVERKGDLKLAPKVPLFGYYIRSLRKITWQKPPTANRSEFFLRRNDACSTGMDVFTRKKQSIQTGGIRGLHL